MVFIHDNLWFSSVQTCRRAEVVRDFVSFAILGFVCDNLWSSSVQKCRRAQVVRDLGNFAALVFVRAIVYGLRTYERVGAHKSFAML